MKEDVYMTALPRLSSIDMQFERGQLFYFLLDMPNPWIITLFLSTLLKDFLQLGYVDDVIIDGNDK